MRQAAVSTFLLPNGNLYAWTSNSLPVTLANAPVATLPTAYYQNPNFLSNPAVPGPFAVQSSVSGVSVTTTAVMASISGNTLTVTDLNYVGSVTVYVTVTDGYLTATKTFTVTFTDASPPTLTVNPTTSTVAASTHATATLTPSSGSSYTSVQIGGYSLPFTVEQQLDLTAPPGTSNYFYNARGGFEKYLVSGNGSNPGAGGGYYILLPNGNLYAWNGNSLTSDEMTPVIGGARSAPRSTTIQRCSPTRYRPTSQPPLRGAEFAPASTAGRHELSLQ